MDYFLGGISEGITYGYTLLIISYFIIDSLLGNVAKR